MMMPRSRKLSPPMNHHACCGLEVCPAEHFRIQLFNVLHRAAHGHQIFARDIADSVAYQSSVDRRWKHACGPCVPKQSCFLTERVSAAGQQRRVAPKPRGCQPANSGGSPRLTIACAMVHRAASYLTQVLQYICTSLSQSSSVFEASVSPLCGQL